MLIAIGCLAALGAGGWWWLRTPAFTIDVNPDRNILLVTIDTLRADVLGAYGGRAITPNLDRLAATGVRFAFAHAHAVVTLPSHATILTGRYPYEHGIRDNTGYRLAAGQATAATLLKARGFATGAFVGGFPLDHRFGLNAGFDVYDDKLDPAGNGEPGDRERRADAVVRSASDWIGRQAGTWFAWVHVYDPHATYAPPAEWAARFPSDPYLGEVSWTDAALGPLFERLAVQSRPTLVIVTADHGESLGEHGELTHGLFAYESTLRVPLLIAEIRPARAADARARSSSGRDRRRGEAGEDRHLHRPEVRARVRGDRDLRRHRQEDRDWLPASTPSSASASASFVTSSESSRYVSARREPSSLCQTAASSSARSPLAQRWTQFQARLSFPPTNHVAHSGPAGTVDDFVPGLRELEAHVLDRRGPEALRLLGGEANERGVVVEAELPREAQRVRALAHPSLGVQTGSTAASLT